MLRSVNLFTAFCFGLASTAALADFDASLKAYEVHDYATTFNQCATNAKSGDAKCQIALGELYSNGLGVPQDYAEAARWFRKAADQGVATAQFNLGTNYYKGQGVHQDYAEAVRWYRKAADQGVAAAKFNLGAHYDKGLGVPQDYAEAARWYRKAADQGDADAQYNLAVLYENGRGVPQSNIVAYAFYNLSATKYPSENDAISKRKAIANAMTEQQIEQGQKLSSEMSAPGAILKALDRYIQASYRVVKSDSKRR